MLGMGRGRVSQAPLAEEIVDFTPRENVAERLAKRFGAGMGEALARLGLLGNLALR